MWGQVALGFQQGDWYIYAMLILAFIGLVVFFERLFMLQFVYHVNTAKFTDELRKMILAEDFNRAINFCKKVGSHSLPKISLKALEAAESDPSRVRGVIEEESLALLPDIEKRISAIPAIAVLILLVGILGTIDHLWVTFNAIDILDTAKKQATVSQGVASSLTHSALGLACCIILMLAHHVIRATALGLIAKVQHGVTVVTNLVAPAMAFAAPVAVAATASAAPIEHNESAQNTEEYVADANAQGEQTPAPQTESFNEAAVDDIKDEEEII